MTKRILAWVLCWLLLCPVLTELAVPVLASQVISYAIPVYVTNNGSTSYTSLPTIVTINNTWMAANGFLGSSGLDARMLQGSTSLPTMVCDDKTLTVVSSSLTSSQASLSYTTGNADATSFSIIPGYSGYFTVPDASSLEPTNNFTDIFNDVLLTSTAGDILLKSSAMQYYYNGSDTVTCTLGEYPVISSSATSTDATGTTHSVQLPVGITSNGLLIVIFTACTDTNITFPSGYTLLFNQTQSNLIRLGVAYRFTTGSEGSSISVTTAASTDTSSIVLYITEVDTSTAPQAGTAVIGASTAPNPPSLTTTWSSARNLWLAVADARLGFTNYPSGFEGWLIQGSANTATAAAYLNYTGQTLDPGAFTCGSAAWVANTIAIKPLTTGIASTSVSGISPGLHTLTVEEDSSGFWMSVDSSVSSNQTALLVGDNSDNWTVMSDTVASLGSWSHYVGGVLKAQYQPTAIISGTTLPDASGNSQNATITFGTNLSGISVTLGTMISSSSSGASSSTTTVPAETVSTISVSNWFGAPDLTKLASNPLRLFVLIISQNSDMSEAETWQWLGLAFVLFCTMLAAVSLKGHLLIAGIAAGVSIGVLVQQTIWPMWSLVFAVVAVLAGVIAERLPWI